MHVAAAAIFFCLGDKLNKWLCLVSFQTQQFKFVKNSPSPKWIILFIIHGHISTHGNKHIHALMNTHARINVTADTQNYTHARATSAKAH